MPASRSRRARGAATPDRASAAGLRQGGGAVLDLGRALAQALGHLDERALELALPLRAEALGGAALPVRGRQLRRDPRDEALQLGDLAVELRAHRLHLLDRAANASGHLEPLTLVILQNK